MTHAEPAPLVARVDDLENLVAEMGKFFSLIV
jgi:hypothetical protein